MIRSRNRLSFGSKLKSSSLLTLTEIDALEKSLDWRKTYIVQPKEIGRGHFSKVFLVTSEITNESFAAKVIRRRKGGIDRLDKIRKEAEIIKRLNEKNINSVIKLIETHESFSEVVLICELACGGSLFNLLQDSDAGLNQDYVKCVIFKVLLALESMHLDNIVHLDIKADNILLREHFPSTNIAICDFGLATELFKGINHKELVGTPDYMAPEVANYDKITFNADMWSVGVLTYYLLTKISPFMGQSKDETLLNVSKAKILFDSIFDQDEYRQSKHFISSLCLKSPNSRLSSSKAQIHIWFENIVDLNIDYPLEVVEPLPIILSNDEPFDNNLDMNTTVDKYQHMSLSKSHQWQSADFHSINLPQLNSIESPYNGSSISYENIFINDETMRDHYDSQRQVINNNHSLNSKRDLSLKLKEVDEAPDEFSSEYNNINDCDIFTNFEQPIEEVEYDNDSNDTNSSLENNISSCDSEHQKVNNTSINYDIPLISNFHPSSLHNLLNHSDSLDGIDNQVLQEYMSDQSLDNNQSSFIEKRCFSENNLFKNCDNLTKELNNYFQFDCESNEELSPNEDVDFVLDDDLKIGNESFDDKSCSVKEIPIVTSSPSIEQNSLMEIYIQKDCETMENIDGKSKILSQFNDSQNDELSNTSDSDVENLDQKIKNISQIDSISTTSDSDVFPTNFVEETKELSKIDHSILSDYNNTSIANTKISIESQYENLPNNDILIASKDPIYQVSSNPSVFHEKIAEIQNESSHVNLSVLQNHDNTGIEAIKICILSNNEDLSNNNILTISNVVLNADNNSLNFINLDPIKKISLVHEDVSHKLHIQNPSIIRKDDVNISLEMPLSKEIEITKDDQIEILSPVTRTSLVEISNSDDDVMENLSKISDLKMDNNVLVTSGISPTKVDIGLLFQTPPKTTNDNFIKSLFTKQKPKITCLNNDKNILPEISSKKNGDIPNIVKHISKANSDVGITSTNKIDKRKEKALSLDDNYSLPNTYSRGINLDEYDNISCVSDIKKPNVKNFKKAYLFNSIEKSRLNSTEEEFDDDDEYRKYTLLQNLSGMCILL